MTTYTPAQIREVRESMGLTQKQFGRLLGFRFPQQMLSRLERGDGAPSNQTAALITIAKKLFDQGYKLDHIFTQMTGSVEGLN